MTTDSTETSTSTVSLDGPSDADMLAAVRAAREEASPVDGDEAGEAGEAGELETSGEAEAAGQAAADAGGGGTSSPSDDDEETELSVLRKQRSKIESEQQAREKLRAQVLAELRAEMTQAAPKREDLLAEARREWLERFRRDPVGAFRESEVDGASAVARLAEAASPEGKLHAKVAELEAAILRLTGDDSPAAKRIAALEAETKRAQDAYQAALRQREERDLVAQVEAAAAQAPIVRAFFDDDGLVVRRGREIAREYCEAKGVDTCPFPVIVQELRAEARREAPKEIARLQARIAKLSTLLQKPAGEPAAPQPTETTGRQLGQRTLSAKAASERRATPKPSSEMSDAERDEAALAAAKEALAGLKRGTRTIGK